MLCSKLILGYNLFLVSEDEADEVTEKRVVRIFTVDFPRYFVAVTRVRQDSKTIGASGGSVKSSVSQAVATFPDGAISKDIKVGLQVSSCSSSGNKRVSPTGDSYSDVIENSVGNSSGQLDLLVYICI